MATDNFEEIVLKYTADTKQASANVETLGKENDNTAEAVGDVNSQLGDLPGASGQAVKGVTALRSAFTKLLANPIVLVIAGIVAVVTTLFSAFDRTAGGGDTLSKVFDGLEAAIGPVLDSLGKLATGIVSFLSGDFQKGIDEMSGSFTGLAGEIETAYINAGLLVDLKRELSQMNRELIVGESELTLQMDKQRAILDDVSKPIQDRIDANNKLNDLNKELLASRQAVIDKQLEEAQINKDQAGLDDDALEEAKDRIAELTAARNNAEGERFRIEKEFVVKRNDLKNQELAQDTERAMLRAQLENEEFRMEEERKAEEFAITSERLQGQKITEVQLETDTVLQLQAIDKDYTKETALTSEERQAIADKEFAHKVGLANASSNLLSALSSVAGKNVKLQKAFAISSAVISTLTAGAQVLADPSAITPIQKAISLAAILVTGFATVSKIASTKVPGGGPSSFTRPNISTGSISGQNGGFQNSNQGIPADVSVVNQSEQPPIRAFVMEGEVTSKQEASAEANAKSEL